MQKLEKSPFAVVSRFFMASLFVGTLWMASAGCWDHDDRDHHDHWDHHDDHDHDHEMDHHY